MGPRHLGGSNSRCARRGCQATRAVPPRPKPRRRLHRRPCREGPCRVPKHDCRPRRRKPCAVAGRRLPVGAGCVSPGGEAGRTTEPLQDPFETRSRSTQADACGSEWRSAAAKSPTWHGPPRHAVSCCRQTAALELGWLRTTSSGREAARHTLWVPAQGGSRGPSPGSSPARTNSVLPS